jgi:phosphatidylglycerophosphate synthase
MLNKVPLALVCLRILLAPVMLALAVYRPEPAGFAACLIAAFLSDFFDGVIARRLGIATPGLRRLDSCADSIFCFSALAAVWMLHPAVIYGYAVPLAILLLLEISRYILDIFKFRREASYHMWSSKLWGLTLFLGFFMLLVMGQSVPWVGVTLVAGIVSDIEGLIISVLLPTWRHDVPSLVHAWKIRAHWSADDR